MTMKSDISVGGKLSHTYIPTPTAALFLGDRKSIVKGLIGPVGSGKSVCCLMDLLLRATEQQPNSAGVRRTRFAIVRDTYRVLATTTIKTFEEWVSPECSRISREAPFIANVWGELDDGTLYESEFVFLALDRPDDCDKLLSMELTGAWLNEARTVSKTIFTSLLERTGRFPPRIDAPTTWAGIVMDTNPPDTDHWYYRLAEEERPAGYHFFRQPGGVMLVDGVYVPNPAAENIDHLPLGYDYYLRQCVPGADVNYITVMMMGEYGAIRGDRPVYPGFSDRLHVSPRPLEILRNRPIELAFDFGLTPACVFYQQRDDGQMRVLRECYLDYGDIRQLASQEVKPLLNREFRDMEIRAVGDPAGMAGAQGDLTVNCFGELLRQGIPARPSPVTGNRIGPRIQAVAELLGRIVTRGEPALILDPSCTRLRKGFLSGYHFRRKSTGDGTMFRDEPEKNEFSHIHDALQYGALEVVRPLRRDEASRGGERGINMRLGVRFGGDDSDGWSGII